MGRITEEEFVKTVMSVRETMFRLAYGILGNVTDTEDAIAEAVLTAWKYSYQLRDKDKFSSWLLKIAVNTAKDMRFRKNREILLDQIPEQHISESHEQLDIWQYVMQLKYEYRILVILFYYEEMSLEQIAQITGVPKGTVKSRLYRARKKLKTLLPEHMYNRHDDREVT